MLRPNQVRSPAKKLAGEVTAKLPLKVRAKFSQSCPKKGMAWSISC